MNTQSLLSFGISSLIALSTAAVAQASVTLSPAGTYSTGIFDGSAAEIAAYDPVTQYVFITNAADNAIDVINIADPTNPALVFSIELDGGVNSVSTYDGIVAAAVEADNTQEPGQVVFFDTEGTMLNSVTVGALPDMLTFTPDGTKVLVANEGEPSEDYSVDPEGSVSIIDLSNGVSNATVTTAGFSQFNDAELDESVRIFGQDATVAQDIEPEYITVSPDSSTAWVALQENNALGILDVNAGEIIAIVGLGFKDHSLPENSLDASNLDEAINFASYENLFGVYQPDAIAAYTADGNTYIVSANEGDSRLRPTGDDEIEGLEEGDLFNEEARIADLTLDPTAFPDAAMLQDDAVLGRLKVTTTMGDTDGDGDFDELYAYGARSFSIWDAEGNRVYDSGNEFAQIVADAYPDDFNSTNDENGSFDDRSDDKGIEPEGVTIGQIGTQTYAFIGLERIGGVMVYDVTNPEAPEFQTYVNNRDFAGDAEAGTAGDLGPEGLVFVSEEDSPTGTPLLIVTNEVSGTTTIFTIEVE
ncbi:MAG: choice-of-anchor I family protein [Leptolyngbyaceae bacterium]|nr:choice-of-anchor I family protein [Leptolyngbyaceae bacterium]